MSACLGYRTAHNKAGDKPLDFGTDTGVMHHLSRTASPTSKVSDRYHTDRYRYSCLRARNCTLAETATKGPPRKDQRVPIHGPEARLGRRGGGVRVRLSPDGYRRVFGSSYHNSYTPSDLMRRGSTRRLERNFLIYFIIILLYISLYTHIYILLPLPSQYAIRTPR
ncbi:hypothetical protein HOY82DRAFT_180140 [Tuber indicum]|nr:hypothetical protein HOY82DRAFT_180140 [Tuber indicum]